MQHHQKKENDLKKKFFFSSGLTEYDITQPHYKIFRERKNETFNNFPMAFSQEFEGECLEIINRINHSAPNPSKQGHSQQNNYTFSKDLPQYQSSCIDEDCII